MTDRVHEIEQALITAGFDVLAQPQRERLASWLKAADLEEEVFCPVDGTFYGRMPVHVALALTTLERKRVRR